MQKKLFRQKSLDRISSPESLNEYLHVTNVSIWVVLIAVILMLGGLFVWSGIASVESFAYGVAQVEDNVLKMHGPERGRRHDYHGWKRESAGDFSRYR